MFPSAPTLSTVSALPFSLSFPFPTDTPSSRSSAPSSVSSSSSHSSVSSSVASSSPQSYRASPLSSLSNSSYWENEDQHESAPPRTHCCTHKSVQVTFRTSVTADFLSSNLPYNTRSEVQSDAVPIEQRQHPRRTHRLIHVNSKSGNASAPASRAPPALVRQSERKEVFVDSLVDSTTQMIETIWPLSVLSGTRDCSSDGPDQTLIGLRTFVQEVLRRSKTSYSTLQVALYYLILIKAYVPTRDFTMEQPMDSPACRAMQCGRRMFLTALILASKYLQDRNYSARAWSKISGLRTSEINANEMAFLAAINWKLHIPEPLFNRWTDLVLKYSPASSNSPLSPSASARSWKSVIPRITPDLDEIEFGLASVTQDARHIFGEVNPGGPSALPTPPPEYWSPTFFEPKEQTPTYPYENCKALEPNPCGIASNRPVLPPLQCPGLLPTPVVTPQTGPLCTPAVSACGFGGLKSSMSAAMSHVQNNILARSTLDNLNNWKPSCHSSIPTSSRRLSVAPPSSTFSSPESMVSDVSYRRSRSSSISSVASSTCALPQLRLAVQATRRCAQMKLSSLREGDPAIVSSSPHDDLTWDMFRASPDDITNAEGDYFSRMHRNLPKVSATDSNPTAITPKSGTHDIASALHEHELPHRLVHSIPKNSRKRENASMTDLSVIGATHKSGDASHRMMPCPSTTSRKRERPSSVDLSVQSRVRDLIAPRCLGDITNETRTTAKENTVLPDSRLAESFLVLSQDFPSSSDVKMNQNLMKNLTPRKRACAAGATKENCNFNYRLIKERFATPAPGMWDGII